MSEVRVIANRYRITATIDQGGMGDIYSAVDQTTGQTVAVKALKPQIVQDDPTLLERFRREANALGKLNHPNIIRVLDTVNEDERHYIIMEYVGAGSLAKLLKKTPQLPIERVLQLALDLSDALTRTHRLNIIHRDIKPANVLLADDGTPKLTDFGVASMGDAPGTMLTQVGSILGTVAYLSPEVCEGATYNEKSDIWAFGVLMYEMLTGRLPFLETSAVMTIASILNDEVPDPRQFRPDIPVTLVNLINSMLTKNPDNRIAGARAVGAEVEAILKRETIELPSVRRQAQAPPPPAAPTGSVNVTPATPGNTPVSLPPRPSAPRPKISKEPLIFMCYRREDTGEISGRIHEYLTKTFGESAILRDVDRISDRTVSRLVLANDVVSHSDVMVIVIGKNWTGVNSKSKGIENPKDPIRIQIEAALKRPEMVIIPVLVDGTPMPPNLPPSIQPIVANEPLVITDAPLDGQLKRLTNRIRDNFGGGRSGIPMRSLIAVVVLIILAILGFALSQNMPSTPGIVTPTTAPATESSSGESLFVVI